ncbi:MAG: type IV toxin-antitoxin system AbiEi family antitoxin [Niabella sp.]
MNENQLVDTVLPMLRKNARFEGYFQGNLKMLNLDYAGELHITNPKDLPVFKVQIRKELRQYQLPGLLIERDKNPNYMIMAEKIFPTIKEQLRNYGINHVDAAGNIFIKTPDQTIWIDGNKYTPPKQATTNKAFTKTGLKVIFYLLINEDAINLPYRQIAAGAGVALGNIKNIIDGLQELGYLLAVNKKEFRLQNRKELLERWVTAYGEKLKPALYLGAYNFLHANKVDWKQLPLDAGKAVWSGEPGADLLTNYLNPEILTVYTVQKAELVKKWRIVPNENGNIRIFQKFWTADLYDQKMYAPAVLIYADLLLTDDPRCHETAMMIYDQKIKYELQ